MYTSFYNLDSKPFENNPDTSFLWIGETQKEALSTLHYGLLENKGFLFLQGEAGVGKTILVNALIRGVDKDVKWAVIPDPSLERIDFYNAIARGFGIEKQFTSKVQFLIQFSHFLHKADDEKRKVVLVVDDCQRLNQEMLEELRLLSNIEKGETKLINIYFVGQPTFNDMLGQPKNRAIQQRLTLKAEIKPLNVNETEDYIRHRLKIAGKLEKLFTAKAIQMIHRSSQGVPKWINVICDHALVAGSELGKQSIDHKIIEQCLQKLDLPVAPGQKDFEIVSGEKSDLDSFKEKHTPGTIPSSSPVTGFNLERDQRRGSWLKYGVGALLVLVGGIYFWVSSQQPMETTQTDTVVAEKTPVLAKDISEKNSSPAVAMLEENRNEINGRKAAELKALILEKAYRSTENKQEKKPQPLEDGTERVGQPVVHVSPLVQSTSNADGQGGLGGKNAETEQVVALDLVPEQASVEQVAPETERELVVRSVEHLAEEGAAVGTTLPGEGSSGDVVVLKKGAGKVVKTLVEEKPVTQQLGQLKPLEPRTVVLGLQPNSLKLTNSANKQLQSFVKKLKEYPRAMVLVKGFVSSKSNSPSNIELSEKRAMGVQTLLVARGIDVEQIEVRGMGNQEQLAPNTTRAGRTKNRRVEIIVISDGL